MKKILSIIAVMILCVSALTGCGCMPVPRRVDKVDGVYDRRGQSIHRCKGENHECGSTCIKDIEVNTQTSYYIITIKYYDDHVESIKAPINSTYIYYADAEDR